MARRFAEVTLAGRHEKRTMPEALVFRYGPVFSVMDAACGKEEVFPVSGHFSRGMGRPSCFILARSVV